jgi:hypothetical protein
MCGIKIQLLLYISNNAENCLSLFGSLDRLALQPCTLSHEVYQGGRDGEHLNPMQVGSRWKLVSRSHSFTQAIYMLYNCNMFGNNKNNKSINNGLYCIIIFFQSLFQIKLRCEFQSIRVLIKGYYVVSRNITNHRKVNEFKSRSN